MQFGKLLTEACSDKPAQNAISVFKAIFPEGIFPLNPFAIPEYAFAFSSGSDLRQQHKRNKFSLLCPEVTSEVHVDPFHNLQSPGDPTIVTAVTRSATSQEHFSSIHKYVQRNTI